MTGFGITNLYVYIESSSLPILERIITKKKEGDSEHIYLFQMYRIISSKGSL